MFFLAIASVASTIFILCLVVAFNRKIKFKTPFGALDVPTVSGSLPFVGHGIAFSKDILGFTSSCCRKYGKIFKLKIFRNDVIVVCDRALAAEFFKTSEDILSLNDTLSRLYFDYAFVKNPNFLNIFIAVVRKSIAVRFDDVVPKIRSEAERMLDRLKAKCASGTIKIDLTQEMFKFIASTSSRCFISVELGDEIFTVVAKFTQLLNSVIVLTYFFPKWFLHVLFNPWMSRLRAQLVQFLQPEIQKYREDPAKTESMIFRTAVDYVDDSSGEGLSDEDIGGIILCLLYVGSENTSLGTTNVITDLASHPKYWDLAREECRHYIEQDDIKGLYNSPLLNACVMESARQTPHIFSLNRQPRNKGLCLGDYHIGNSDCVAVCGPMLMLQDYALELFKDPLQYNPSRFLGPKHESFNQYSVMTWGAGLHLCPGKMFALYEIKMAVALFLLNFELELEKGSVSELNYFSPSAFAERRVHATLKLAPRKGSGFHKV